MHAQWMIKHECLCRVGYWRRGREEKRKRLVELDKTQTDAVIPHLTKRQSTGYRTCAAKGRCCEVGGTETAARAGAANKKKINLFQGEMAGALKMHAFALALGITASAGKYYFRYITAVYY